MILKAIYHPEIHLKSMHEVVQSVDAYKISIDGAELQFAVSVTDEFYPSSFGRYRLLWKLRENAYDYEYYLYCLLRELYNIEKEWSLELQDIMQPYAMSNHCLKMGNALSVWLWYYVFLNKKALFKKWSLNLISKAKSGRR